MNELGVETAQTSRQRPSARNKRGLVALIVFAGIWLLLIGGGVYGAKLHSEQLQQRITADIERQTSAQIADMQQTYNARIEALESGYAADLAALNDKVEALNELLTFTRDNADDRTDNSNRLYTQLNEVKQQLNELKKSLDVLK